MANNLKKYNAKRNFKKTKEPIGKERKPIKQLRFVIQHHLARRDHYDLRLEWLGTLKSWAVPKGPSYSPKDKRLAVQVEDHPLSYRNFEGTIPKGEYGGGTVMVWDEGYWEPITKNPDFQKGEIKFILKGKRLKGSWTLVPFKEDNYLLIKEKDEYVDYTNISKYTTSIKTGRTMDEIANNEKKKNKDEIDIVDGITITHPNKLIFTNPTVTKLDIAKYYEQVAPRMLPFLKNRLISTIRLPQGVDGDKFFKKHLEKHPGIKKKKFINDSKQKEDYYYITNVDGLINEVQMNSYEYHIWGSNVKNIEKPDMMVFDLDPDEKMPLAKVREGVRDLKKVLDELKLTSFLKTSGGKGYHIVVPINSIANWEDFRTVAQNIAKLLEQRYPKKYVSNMRKEKRKNKIFIDWVRNTRSATSVAPYSVRLRKKAYVSMPIAWNELDNIKPNGITIEDAIKRLRRKDPWDNFFDIKQ